MAGYEREWRPDSLGCVCSLPRSGRRNAEGVEEGAVFRARGDGRILETREKIFHGEQRSGAGATPRFCKSRRPPSRLMPPLMHPRSASSRRVSSPVPLARGPNYSTILGPLILIPPPLFFRVPSTFYFSFQTHPPPPSLPPPTPHDDISLSIDPREPEAWFSVCHSELASSSFLLPFFFILHAISLDRADVSSLLRKKRPLLFHSDNSRLLLFPYTILYSPESFCAPALSKCLG